MKDKERIMALLESIDEKPATFAKIIGVHSTNIYHILNGRNGISDGLVSSIISKYNQVNPVWLKKGTGDMYIKAVDNESLLSASSKTITMALGDYEFGDLSADDNSEKFIIPGISEGFLVRVRDDSMSPLFKPGDMLSARFTDPELPVVWGKNYIVITGRLGFIRRLVPAESDDSIKMVSANLSYPDFTVKKNTITKLAKISGVIHLE